MCSLLLLLLALASSLQPADVRLTLGTCNLWNVMFNWEVRVMHIADMVREADMDILVFQEVRMSALTDSLSETNIWSQLQQFRSLLPEYRWVAARPAGPVGRPKNAVWKGWEMEGLGIISRKEILSVKVVNLTVPGSVDKNLRIALHAKIRSGPSADDVVSVWVVHFSYDRHQQCQNALDIIGSISSDTTQFGNVFILGDFNAYNDFRGPMDVFVSRRATVCSNKSPRRRDSAAGTFVDAWMMSGRQHRDGLTFSNMPSPGLESRPDRILVPKNAEVESIALMGNGDDYASFYYFSIMAHRAKVIVAASYDSLRGRSGYPCRHDCGPHGSCRCGVCVRGGNNLNCDIPSCEECDSRAFVIFISLFTPFCVTATILFYAVLRMLVVSARFSQKDIEDILGYRCCLFNKRLFRFGALPRRYKTLVSRILCVCELPPLLLILLTVIILLILGTVMRYTLRDAIDVVYSVLPEELFPSDHLLLYASIKT
ncbi:uncharacterized protein LOC101847287 [Aplysia californica]|uniref:Uncharacterized protein LOC101847287 n=1 Tax=Aplysia californica TaxID=6500 RepID=A0ABM0K5I3_APLCA|nr:uncharacterized protein LOC101847287 [Aplysia californica]